MTADQIIREIESNKLSIKDLNRIARTVEIATDLANEARLASIPAFSPEELFDTQTFPNLSAEIRDGFEKGVCSLDLSHS